MLNNQKIASYDRSYFYQLLQLPPLDNSDPFSEVANEGTQVRRSERVRAPSRRYPTSNYILLTSEGEPESFQEAQSHIDKANWQKAMEEEMNSLQKNQTYELVKLPKVGMLFGSEPNRTDPNPNKPKTE